MISVTTGRSEPAARLEPRLRSQPLRLAGPRRDRRRPSGIEFRRRAPAGSMWSDRVAPRRSRGADHSRSGTDQTESERPRHGRFGPCRPPDSLDSPGVRPCSRQPSRLHPATLRNASSTPQKQPAPKVAVAMSASRSVMYAIGCLPLILHAICREISPPGQVSATSTPKPIVSADKPPPSLVCIVYNSGSRVQGWRLTGYKSRFSSVFGSPWASFPAFGALEDS